MSSAAWMGALLAAAGGALQGAFGVPLKYARKWNHENIWLVFTLTGLVLFPWILAFTTVPSLSEVYQQATLRSLIVMIVCGIGWGIGAVLVGVAFQMLGIGLAFAIILALSAFLGAIVPFFIQPQPTTSASEIHFYLIGGSAMLIGIVLVSIAGSIREQAESGQTDSSHAGRRRFAIGMIIAILAGILSSLLSDAIAFSSGIVAAARQAGASPVWAANVVTAPTTTGGALANFAYCAVMLNRNRSTKLFWQASVASHWAYGIAMGTFWYGGLAVYGLAEQRVGSVNGWPLFIGAMILSSSAAAFLTGEWKSVGQRGKIFLCCGSLLILLGLIIVGMAQSG